MCFFDMRRVTDDNMGKILQINDDLPPIVFNDFWYAIGIIITTRMISSPMDDSKNNSWVFCGV